MNSSDIKCLDDRTFFQVVTVRRETVFRPTVVYHRKDVDVAPARREAGIRPVSFVPKARALPAAVPPEQKSPPVVFGSATVPPVVHVHPTVDRISSSEYNRRFFAGDEQAIKLNFRRVDPDGPVSWVDFTPTARNGQVTGTSFIGERRPSKLGRNQLWYRGHLVHLALPSGPFLTQRDEYVFGKRVAFVLEIAESLLSLNPRCSFLASSHGEITEGDDMSQNLWFDLRKQTYCRVARKNVMWKNLAIPVVLSDTVAKEFAFLEFSLVPLTNVNLRNSIPDIVQMANECNADKQLVRSLILLLLAIAGVEPNPGPSIVHLLCFLWCFGLFSWFMFPSTNVEASRSLTGAGLPSVPGFKNFSVQYGLVLVVWIPIGYLAWRLRGPALIATFIQAVVHFFGFYISMIKLAYSFFMRGLLTVAVVSCVVALFSIVALLLLRAGIEPNPGPPKVSAGALAKGKGREGVDFHPSASASPSPRGDRKQAGRPATRKPQRYKQREVKPGYAPKHDGPKVTTAHVVDSSEMAKLNEVVKQLAALVPGGTGSLSASDKKEEEDKPPVIPERSDLTFSYWFVPAFVGNVVESESIKLLAITRYASLDVFYYTLAALELGFVLPIILIFRNWYLVCISLILSAFVMIYDLAPRFLWRRTVSLTAGADKEYDPDLRDISSMSTDAKVSVDSTDFCTLRVNLFIECHYGLFNVDWLPISAWLFHWIYDDVSFLISRELFDNCAEYTSKLAPVLEEQVVNRVDMLTSAVRMRIGHDRSVSASEFLLAGTRTALAHYARSARSVSGQLFRPSPSSQALASGW